MSAGSGHEAIRDYASGFRAVASTLDTSAPENTGTDRGRGVPIYWLGANDCYKDWDRDSRIRRGSGLAAFSQLGTSTSGSWGLADDPDIDCDDDHTDTYDPQLNNQRADEREWRAGQRIGWGESLDRKRS